MKLGTRVAYKVLPPLLAAAMVSVCLPASVAFAETLTVDNIETTGEGFTVTVPSVVAVDTNLTEADIRALFTGEFGKTAGALATLEATSITIPEIKVSYDLPAVEGVKQKGVITYHDVELSNVSKGIAASSLVGGADWTGIEDAVVTMGAMSTGTFNIAALLGFYGLTDAPASKEMATVYQDFNFEGGELKSKDANCEIGSITLAQFKARPLTTSFTQVMALAEEMSNEKPSPEAIKTFIGFYTDILTAFESSPMEFSGFTCTATEDGKPVEISTGTITVDGFSPGIYPAISASDINISVEGDGKVALGNITSKAIDFNAVIDFVKSATGPFDEKWIEANYRKVIPAYEGFSLSDIAVDVPDESNPGERIVANVGAFDLTLLSYVNGIPTDIATSGSDIEITLPKDSTEDSVKSLVELGFDKLNVGFSLAAHWNEAEDTIVISDLTTSGDKLGSVTLTGTIGNATETLFGDDLDMAMMAGMGLTVKDIKIDLADEGIAAIALASAAKEQGQDVETFKTALSGMAQGTALAILGGTAEAKGVGEALDAFIKGAPFLSIALVAKDTAGVGMAEFMAIESDPTALAKVMTITAKAEGEAPAAVEAPAATTTEAPAPTDGKEKNK